MKKLACCLAAFIFFSILPNADMHGILHEAAPSSDHTVLAEKVLEHDRMITPVHPDERELAERINSGRKANHLPAILPDWDLFRLARASAGDLEERRIREIDASKISRILELQGQYGYRLITASFRTQSGNGLDQWLQTDAAADLLANPHLDRIGVGCFQGHAYRTCAVLAGEPVRPDSSSE